MHLVVRSGDGEREVAVDLRSPDATVADLLDALGHAGDGATVDGRFVAGDVLLRESGILEGSVVTPDDDSSPVLPPAQCVLRQFTVVAGPATGTRFPLPPGRHRIGRDHRCEIVLDDDTVSLAHATVAVSANGAVRVADDGSRNGTWTADGAVAESTGIGIGDVVRCGASVLRLDGPDKADRPHGIEACTASGTVAFNRPPALAGSREPGPITAPGPSPQTPPPRPFNAVAVLAPLAMGAAMVWFTGNLRFALFALLSPVMALGNWWTSRRQARRETRKRQDEHRQALAAFGAALAQTAVAARRRLEESLPDVAEIGRRATWPSTSLWHRRLDHPDALRLRIGTGDRPFEPPIDVPREGLDDAAALAVAAHRVLSLAPIDVDLTDGGVVGIVGPRPAAVAIARALVCQAAVLHGPADLPMTICTRPDGVSDWRWAVWLPHTRTSDGRRRRLAGNDRDGVAVLDDARTETATPGSVHLCVIDAPALLEGRAAPGREILRGAAGPVAGIVIAPTEDDLPALCRTVVRTHDGPTASLIQPYRESIDPVITAPMTVEQAQQIGRALARFEDPELRLPSAGLPRRVSLGSLLGTGQITPEAIERAWQDPAPDPVPVAPLGWTADGPVIVDLDRDGPHGLVGGTTGAGKSELLRTLVAGMAARLGPEHLVFVLIDYKGGSAFDAAARLPHTVGLVTDLDEHLGQRALRSLEAELHRREQLLRDAGASDRAEYLANGAAQGPLPRLVVVIDEFATMAAELPDFLGALIGIAQRGRSLGVHLLLATQRPQGVVNANIKANTNLRIALRVQDPSDSSDLIDRPDAALIDPETPGRAYLRRGPSEAVLFQSARCTAPAPDQASAPVAVAPLQFGPRPARFPTPRRDDHGPTELSQLVAACQEAFRRTGAPPPRRPWLPMLANSIPLADILAGAEPDPAVAPFAMADDPDAQTQRPVGWRPADGHLAVFGTIGAGKTTTLLAVAAALAHQHPPDAVHLYGLDFGAGGLESMRDLPHTGALVAAGDREAQYRLLRMLADTIDRRRALSPNERNAEPRITVLLDGIGAFLAEHDGLDGAAITDTFQRAFADGPAVGITFAVAGERPGAMPMRLLSQVRQKLLLRLADPAEFASVGLRPKALPSFVPGRGVFAEGQQVVQVGDPAVELAALADAATPASATNPPKPVRCLPTDVPAEALTDSDPPPQPGPPIRCAVGVRDEDLGTAALRLYPGEHVLVAGPPRSGRSSALKLLSAQLRHAVPNGVQVAIAEAGRSPLHGYASLDGSGPLTSFAALLDAARQSDRPFFFLVDDAATVEDAGGRLTQLLESGRPGVHVLAAVRADDLRGGYGHWTRALRRSRTGLLLQPDLATDGDVFSIRLPRRLHVPLVPGRGFAVHAGQATLVQIAQPPVDPPAGTIPRISA